MWDTINLVPKEALPKQYLDRVNTTPQCESFMHLHLGFDAKVKHYCKSSCLLSLPLFNIYIYMIIMLFRAYLRTWGFITLW